METLCLLYLCESPLFKSSNLVLCEVFMMGIDRTCTATAQWDTSPQTWQSSAWSGWQNFKAFHLLSPTLPSWPESRTPRAWHRAMHKQFLPVLLKKDMAFLHYSLWNQISALHKYSYLQGCVFSALAHLCLIDFNMDSLNGLSFDLFPQELMSRNYFKNANQIFVVTNSLICCDLSSRPSKTA